MDEQFSIFDYLPEPDYPKDLETLPEAEMVSIVSMATGLNFVYDGFLDRYSAKKGDKKYSLKYSRYNLEGKKDRFISVGYDCGGYGQHEPADSIEEAVNFFKNRSK